jgi:hypothetical protein
LPFGPFIFMTGRTCPTDPPAPALLHGHQNR